MPEEFSLGLTEVAVAVERAGLPPNWHPFEVPSVGLTVTEHAQATSAAWHALRQRGLAGGDRLDLDVEDTLRAWTLPEVLIIVRAVEIEDGLYYGEPPEWFYPVRESLGGALLLNGEAGRAEAVFRADLEQYPRNPRSLFGLLKALEAQKKNAYVEEVRREFEAAWKNADRPLELGEL